MIPPCILYSMLTNPIPIPVSIKKCSLFQAFRSWGQRKEMWAEKRTTTTRGWGRGESKGTAVRLLTKARSSIPDSGIPYDWSILTALVSTKRFIKLIGNVTREQWDHTSGYLESMVKWFEISNTINVEYHPYHPYHRSETGSWQRKVGPPNFTIYRLLNELSPFRSFQEC